eukprot:TRINITY_DN12058_c0_g3_i3.p1 TRINITY_DN12058_c0_g3~~TRINITY_DN12058_c0_g3_i3.p1  ORF type:complete len:178 (+),score=12.45 TRINITY_DN12058_c0_g3_i3:825-1358(+)
MPMNWGFSNPKASKYATDHKTVDYHLWINQCYLWTSIALASSTFNYVNEALQNSDVPEEKANKALDSIRVLMSSQVDQFAKNTLTRRSLELSRLTSRKIQVPEGLETESLKRARPDFDPYEVAKDFSKKARIESANKSGNKSNSNYNRGGHRGRGRGGYQQHTSAVWACVAFFTSTI